MLKNMKVKAPKKAPKWLKLTLIVIVTLFIMVGLLFLERGWVRVTLAPKAVQAVHGHSVQAQLDSQVAALGDPLKSLGYAKINAHHVTCQLDLAVHFKTSISCTASYQAYGPVATTDAGKAALRQNAVKLQAALEAAGWDGNPSMPLSQFAIGITKGIDYQPDATYIKQFGAITCAFGTTTAFSSPKPAAMNTVFSCGQDFQFFGDPFNAQATRQTHP